MKALSESEILELLKHPHETDWIEFKHDWAIDKQLGEYISALSNAAAMQGEKEGYFVWGGR